MTEQQAIQQAADCIWQSMQMFGHPDLVGIVNMGWMEWI